MRHAAVVPFLCVLVGCAAVASAAAPGRTAHPGPEAEVRSPVGAAYPGPGWLVASPLTGITFSGVRAASLGQVRVTGSLTGVHAGDVHELRSGRGAVFVPRERFAGGETVTVTTEAAVLGAPDGAFSFTIATDALPTGRRRDHAGAHRDPPRRPAAVGIGTCALRRARFHTRPGFRPSGTCTTRRATPQTAPGRLLLTPRGYPRARPRDEHAVMMLSRSGRLLWYLRRPHVARDLKTVRYGGRRMLAFYQWMPRRRSHYVVVDESYRRVVRIRAGNGYMVNTHELQVTPQGTAYVMAYQRVRVAECACTVSDALIQEIDIATGDVLFEWHALDHVPLSASYQPRPDGRFSWDYFHGNSIEPPTRDGRTIIVSARNTSAIYGIDRHTGDVRWILGGKEDQFGVAPGARFCAQHDARRLAGGDITLFDNGGFALGDEHDCPMHIARAQRFRLDEQALTARLVWAASSGPSSETGDGFLVPAMGSAQRQPNGNMLISWGTNARVTEVTPRGRVVLGLTLARYTYRAILSRWTGTPAEPPRASARSLGNRVTVWASWNGATEVRRWRVLAGRSPQELRPAGAPFRFKAFETAMRLRRAGRYVAVEALDRSGATLARSWAVRVRP